VLAQCPDSLGSAYAIDTGLASSSHRSELGAPARATPFRAAPLIDASCAAAERRVGRALLALFAASGCAALIYQVVWFQLLSFAIGASALSLGVLLPTYLGGLCIGSVLLPRYVSRKAHPLRVLGALELAIGALGVAALYAIPALGGIYSAWAGTGATGLALRLLVAALALLPATILMGATLPAAGPWVDASRDSAARLGQLYAANTAGAVVGCIAAGLYLLRVHDVRVATFVAAALDVAVGLACFALAAATSSHAFSTASHSQVKPDRAVERDLARTIFIATALSGLTALSAEILWTRNLSLLFGGTVYAFAVILAVFLLGLGAGSAAGAALGRRLDARRALAWCQLGLGAGIAWGAYAIARALPYWPLDVTLPSTAALTLELDLLRAAIAILPAALLWGASFPLALAASTRAQGGSAIATATEHDSRRLVGRLYAANTAGAIVGALATSFVLIPALGSTRAQQLSILVAAAAAVLLFATDGRVPSDDPRRAAHARIAGLCALALATALALAWSMPALPPALVAYGRFLPTRGQDANVVYVGEGVAASIAVTLEPSGIVTYHNAGKTQASTYPQDMRLQRMLGHLATLIPERPRSVLVIGLGAGITAGAASIDPAVEHVVVAEIEPLVPKVASEYFAEPNHGVVTNPKVEIRVDDGRHVLATTREKFDAITSDPLDPWVKGAAALYTREFWELCKSHLNDGGVVTAFLQLYETTDDAARSEIATFFSAFPRGALFVNTVNGRGYDAVLVARVNDAPIDVDLVEGRLAEPSYEPVARSLREVGFESGLDLLGTYAGGAADMSGWLRSAALNTDNGLRLQYLAADGLNMQRADDLYRQIVAHGVRFPEHAFVGSPLVLQELRQRLQLRPGAN
jgi:spermidine synthase